MPRGTGAEFVDLLSTWTVQQSRPLRSVLLLRFLLVVILHTSVVDARFVNHAVHRGPLHRVLSCYYVFLSVCTQVLVLMSVPLCLFRDPCPCLFSSHVAAAALSYQGAMRVLCDPDLMARLGCADPRLLSRKYGFLRAFFHLYIGLIP